MMTLFEKLKVVSVKVRRIWWQWKASKLPHAQPNYVITTKKVALGVTLSGGEFTPGGIYPGNYGYPSLESIDYHASKGMKIVRLPFLWERIQPELCGELDAKEMGHISLTVDYIISKGMKVALDLHNGGYYKGDVIGSKSVGDWDFANLWGRLASLYKHHGDNVLFMLMSEPTDQCARQWIKSVNAAISYIRKVGATQTIVVPGSYYDGGWTWCKSDNAKRVGQGVIDPGNNYMFEIHQYMDKDASGGTAGIVSPTIGADRLAEVTTWARLRGRKLFLGEFAAGTDQQSLEALQNMLQYLADNADVWEYATWWGAGDRWSNYQFALDPEDYLNPIDRPQMAVLQKFI